MISAFALITLALVLAGALSWHRAREPLGTRFHPAGWSVSFQPPRGWTPGAAEHVGPTTAIPFHGYTRTGKHVTVAVWRVRGTIAVEPRSVTALILGQDAGAGQPDSPETAATGRVARVGRLHGYEQLGPDGRVVVRAASTVNGAVFALSCRVENAAIDEHTYMLFDLTGQSLEFEEE